MLDGDHYACALIAQYRLPGHMHATALLDWAPERMPKGVEKTTWMSFLNGKSFGNRRMIWTEPSATLPGVKIDNLMTCTLPSNHRHK